MSDKHPMEWELKDSFNTYNFWLKLMRNRGIRDPWQ